jgi:hypothetical protein
MKVVDIGEGKNTTVEKLLQSLIDNKEDLQDVVVCYQMKNGAVDFAWTDMDVSKRVFLLATGQHAAIEDSKVEA